LVRRTVFGLDRNEEAHTDAVASVAFFPDGKRIASASYDGTARIWRAPK
jgi:WD40 repeat protein